MKNTILLIGALVVSACAFSQQTDSLRRQDSFTGAITVTNNGIAPIPSFTLGKPAVLFDLAMRRKRLSIEPQLTFSLAGAKPWYVLVWVRYRAIQRRKFTMGVGFHPSIVFTNPAQPLNGMPPEQLTAVRYFVGELTPTCHLSKKVSLGLYYLQAHGFSRAASLTHFLSLTGNVSQIPLGRAVYLRVNPQVYFVAIDQLTGYYVTSSFTLTSPNLPLALSSIVNQKIKSSIASDDFLWNISLTYTY